MCCSSSGELNRLVILHHVMVCAKVVEWVLQDMDDVKHHLQRLKKNSNELEAELRSATFFTAPLLSLTY
jgi:hypothetical protein